VNEAAPLRVLVIDEGVLGHRTLKGLLEGTLATQAGLEVELRTVPAPSRLGRLLLRRIPGLGDADLLGLRWRLRWSWQARRLLKRHGSAADVALIITQASALLIKGPMKRIPCVLMIDATAGQFTALEYLGPRDRFSARQLRLIARLERRSIRAAAAVVAWSDWNATALREEYGEAAARLEVIHPGLDVAWWVQASRERPQRPADEPLRVLFVGNDVERKGIGTLIDAVAALDGAALLDVVSGDEIAAHDFVTVYHGVQAGTEELRSLYAGADVFALPTRADAVPWAVLEAMAAGLPVIASDVGAIAELLGGSGEVVPPGDAAALAAALRRLRQPELRRALGQRAQERVRDHYDSAVQTPRLVGLLRDVARPGAGGGPRFRRRTVIAAGAGVTAAALVAPYAVLVVGDEFEELVASRLGIEPELAGQLLARARAEYGDAEYDARATAFALAVRDPAAWVMPAAARRKAINGLLEPMLSAPASNLAYAITGSDPGGRAPCSGLVRS
jgi:glycosyltransferase involved in cell wall biosynthesis